MRSTGLLLLLLAALGCFAGSSDPMQIAKAHVLAVMNAIEVKDEDVMKDLFKTDKDDMTHVLHFIQVFQGVKATVQTASTLKDGSIEAKLFFNGKIPGSIVLQKNAASPTGYHITAIGAKKNKNGIKKNFVEFSMCYIGLLWCAIELVVDCLDGKTC